MSVLRIPMKLVFSSNIPRSKHVNFNDQVPCFLIITQLVVRSELLIKLTLYKANIKLQIPVKTLFSILYFLSFVRRRTWFVIQQLRGDCFTNLFSFYSLPSFVIGVYAEFLYGRR